MADGRISFIGRPELRDLFTIKLDDWFKVGTFLGFREEELHAIKKKCRAGGDKECQKRMLAAWKHKMDPQNHSQLMQALINAGETRAVETMIHTPGRISTSVSALNSTSYEYVTSMNIMLSGPDEISKRKVVKAINQVVTDGVSSSLRKGKPGKPKRRMTASELEHAALSFIDEHEEKFHILVKIDLGELAETNELAPLFLSGKFFHFICVNSHHQHETPASISPNQSKQSIFHQALHSIGSLWSKATNASPRSFAAAVVCYFGSIKNAKAVDDALKSSVENCGSCEDGMIKYCAYREKQMVFPVTDDSDDNYQEHLVSTIKGIAKHQHWGTVIPSNVRRFLKKCWNNAVGILKLEEAQELALTCGVPISHVPTILQNFHADCGAIIYFRNVPALENMIICQPQILVDAFNKFVVRMKRNPQVMLNGQIDSTLVDHCEDISTYDPRRNLKSIHIKELLKYYSFISERKMPPTAVCFMPFLLPETRLELYPSMSTFPSPFVIQFSATHSVPSGIFYALACQFFQIWQLKNEQQYKNRIIFQIEGNITCMFSHHHRFIEVTVTGVTESTPQDLFHYIRSEVLENVNIAKEFFPSVKKSNVAIRFFCPHSLNSHHLPHLANVTDHDLEFIYCENPSLCVDKSKMTPSIAVWINTQVASDDLFYLSTLSKMTDECDETMQLVNEHIKHQGSIQLRIAKCLLFGPPNVGKTSTRMRLTGEITNLHESRPQMKSTGIDKPITVNVHHKTESSSVFIAANESDQWKYQDLQAQADMFINYVIGSDQTEDLDADKSNTPGPSPYLDRKDSREVNKSGSSQFDQPDYSINSSPSIVQNTSITTSTFSHTNVVLSKPLKRETTLFQENLPNWLIQENESLSFIQELIKSGRWKEVQMKLRNIDDTTLLQIIDTGGQPEFHEILPLLLPGPALYLLFINLTQKLNESFPIVYTQEGGRQAEISYQSNFTYKEMLLQLFNTISCMNSTLGPTTRSIATLLGTHADQVTREDIATLESEITQCEELKIFLEKSLLKPIPMEGISQSIFPLNNVAGEPVEIQRLQYSLAEILLKHFQSEKLPTSWFFFYLTLRHNYEASPGCCSLDAAISLAAGFNIAPENVPQILDFFHNRFGTVLFYPDISGFKDLIICDPNIIFKPISHLIASSFGENLLDPHLLETIRQTGHVPLDLLQKFNPDGNDISAAMLVDLLKHHNIITEARGPDNTPIYFMPCLLKPDPELTNISPADILGLNLAPLIINFKKSRYVPVGFFPSLVVKLSHKWVLTDQLQHKDHVTFIADSSTCAEIHLLMFADKVEIRVDCDTGKDSRKLCLEALNVVNEAIESLKNSNIYFTKCVPNFGFYCSYGLENEKNLHFATCLDMNAPEKMLCSKRKPCSGKRFPLLPQHKIWFPGHKYVEPEEGADASPPAPPPIDYKVEVHTLLTSNQISTEVIKETAHNELYVELCPRVTPKWVPLGVLLQVDFDQIQIIQEEKKGKLDDCVNAILNSWLKRGNATWESLVKALISDTMGGGFYELAYRIATKHLND